MTENAFYPLFATSALLMLRALERPSAARQLLVAASVGAAFLVRAQAVVLLPSYLLAAVLLAVTASRGRRLSALVACLRRQATTIAVLALAGVAASALSGSSTLGPYHVLVTSYRLRPLAHWGLANLADIELYLGVIPLAAFGILLARAFSSAALSAELRRLVLNISFESRYRLFHSEPLYGEMEPHMPGFQRRRNARLLRYAAKLAILAMKARELLASREYPVSSADLRPRLADPDELWIVDTVERWDEVQPQFEADASPFALRLDAFARKLVAWLEVEAPA